MRPTSRLAFLASAVALASSGCATLGVVTGQTKATAEAMQSETSATTSYAGKKHRVVVAFNDETGNEGKVVYTATTRQINAGASLMGWSYSEDKGKTWTYGGKVAPPPGWAVLWGDPAMTTSGASYATVFLSNLAIPNAKMPANGISGYVTYGSKGAYIGGACIAKSTDGGVTFANHQCVSNKDPDGGDPDAVKGHFYDGGSMASTPAGEVFAAYIDITTSRIEVWRAPNANSAFGKLPNPFPGLVAATHPRLRANLDGSLYVATVVSGPLVYINRYKNGAWQGAVQASETTVTYPQIDLNSSVGGQPLKVRTGPQFSFDVGAASEGESDAIRFLYTRYDGKTQRHFVEGSACALDLSGCHPVAGWRAGLGTPGGTPLEAFNPAVAAWRGFINLPPHWTSSFYERYGQSVTTVNLARMNLAYVNGTALGIPVDLAKKITVCPDNRGYWGDYDDMLHVGFDNTTPAFVRFTSSDHGKGCVQRWTYVARHQHVQSIREP